LADLEDRLTMLQAGVDGLDARMAAGSERAVARERVIDRQHEEIERLRAAQRAGQLRPTVIDLYRLRNDLLRQAATVPAEITGDDVADLLRSYADTVAEALERCGVVVLPRETGTAFVPGRQQVALVVKTDDPCRDGSVAAIVQDGYAETGGTVVAPARVELYRYAAKETTDE
jgi:molecular chaperone GrpE